MPMANLLCLLHVLALAAPSWWALRRHRLPLTVVGPATYFLVWHATVLGATILGAMSKLGHLNAFVVTTLVIGLAQAALVGWVIPRPVALGAEGLWTSPEGAAEPRWQRIAVRYMLLLFGVTWILLAVNAWGHGPMVEDNLTCKLVRSFLFLQNGRLTPIDSYADARVFGVPPYVSYLQDLVLSHRPSLGAINLLGTLAWACFGCGIYQLSLLAGAKRWSAVLAAGLFCFCSCLLFQGSSENDDIQAALPTVWMFVFATQAFRKENVLAGALAGTCLGLGIGAKLYPLLFGPALFLGLLWWWWRGGFWVRFRESAAFRRCGWWLIGTTAVAVAPFAFYNALYTGSPFRLPALLSGIQNKPFSAPVAVQNFGAQNLTALTHGVPQVAAVFVDRGFMSSAAWDGMVKGITAGVNTLLGAGSKGVVDVYSEPLRIAPLTAPGVPHQQLYGDTNVWFGLLPWLLLVAALWCTFTRRSIGWLARCLPWAALSWIALYCASNKFILDIGRYWLPPIALVLPCVALWAERWFAGDAPRWQRWLHRAVLAVVILGTLILIWPSLNESRYRRLSEVGEGKGGQLPVQQVSKRFGDLLSKARIVNVIPTWQFPLFAVAANLGEKGKFTVDAAFSPDNLELCGYVPDYPVGYRKIWPFGLAGVPVDEALAPGVGYLWLGHVITGFDVWGTGKAALHRHSPEKGVYNCVLFKISRTDNGDLQVSPVLRVAAPELEFQASPGHAMKPEGKWLALTAAAQTVVPHAEQTATLFVRVNGKDDAVYRKEVLLEGWQHYSLDSEKVSAPP